MMQKRLLIGLVLFLFIIEGLKAQESINTSGDQALGSGGTLTFSIGQVMYVPQSGPSGSLTVGAQQPFIISIVSGFENTGIQVKTKAYPNPTIDKLYIEVENLNSFVYQLSDLKGHILETGSVFQKRVALDMDIRPKDMYILRVIKSGVVVKTFKIIKN